MLSSHAQCKNVYGSHTLPANIPFNIVLHISTLLNSIALLLLSFPLYSCAANQNPKSFISRLRPTFLSLWRYLLMCPTIPTLSLNSILNSLIVNPAEECDFVSCHSICFLKILLQKYCLQLVTIQITYEYLSSIQTWNCKSLKRQSGQKQKYLIKIQDIQKVISFRTALESSAIFSFLAW